MIPRLKEQFNTELKTSVMEQLSLNNVNEIPTLDKIIINIGDGKAGHVQARTCLGKKINCGI